MQVYSFIACVIAIDLLLLTCLGTILYAGFEADKYVADQDQPTQQEQEQEEGTEEQYTEGQEEEKDTEEEDTKEQDTKEQDAAQQEAVSMELASCFLRLLESAERHKSQAPISEIEPDDFPFDEFREGWAESWGVAPYKLHATSPPYPIGTWLRFLNDYGNQGVVVTNGMFLIRTADGCPVYKTVKLNDWLILAESVGRGAISIPPEGALPPIYKGPTEEEAKKDKDLQDKYIQKMQSQFAEVCSNVCSDCECSQQVKEAKEVNLPRSPTATDLDLPRDYTLPYGDGTVRGVYD